VAFFHRDEKPFSAAAKNGTSARSVIENMSRDFGMKAVPIAFG
jgi:hypothetical protein